MGDDQFTLQPYEATSLAMQERKCAECSETKPLSAFIPRFMANGRLAHRPQCRACYNKIKREDTSRGSSNSAQYAKKKAKFEQRGGQAAVLRATCPRCETEKSVEEFYAGKSSHHGLSSYCIPCTNEVNREANKRRRTRIRTEDPKLWWALCVYNVRRADARKRKAPFTITAQWLASVAPDVCPVLGVALEYPAIDRKGITDSSASVDKFKPEQGYVPGNVKVISFKANSMKSNGTVVEHAKLLAWMMRQDGVTDAERAEVLRILDGKPPLMEAA